MIKLLKTLTIGIFLWGTSACTTNAGEQSVKTNKDNLYDVYEEKLTEDIPLLPCKPDDAVSYLCINADRDSETDGCSAIFEKAEKTGLNTIMLATREIVTSINKDKYRGIPQLDNLDKLFAETKKHNMRVMIMLNFLIAGSDEKETANLLDKDYNERQFRLIDAIAEKNKEYGNIIIFLDEIWCNEGCYLRKNYIDSFKAFCAKEYREEYKKMEMPPKMNPADKWWRRYVVFKNCIYENFCKRLLDYAHKKGIKVENRPYPSYINSNGWKWGMDSYRLSKLADYNQTWFWRDFEGDYYENSLMGMYKNPDALSMSLYLRGYPVQYFCYSYLRDNPWVKIKIPEMTKQAKIWSGAKRKAEICILNYPVALIGFFANQSPKAYGDNDGIITNSLSRYFETDRTDVRNSRFYKNYKVLIIPKYSAYSIPEYTYNEMLEYVKNGGTIIATDAGISIGKRDLTDPKDMTSEIAGIKPVQLGKANGTVEFQKEFINCQAMPINDVTVTSLETKDNRKIRVIASYKENPVITEYRLGKGHVVYIGFNIAELIKKDNKWLDVLKNITMKYDTPAVLSDGKINVESVIKKDNRALISLHPASDDGAIDASKAKPTDQMGDIPAMDKQIDKAYGNLSIDTVKLGLNGDLFQVFAITHCEIMKNKDNKEVWTPGELKKGVSFIIDGKVGYEHLMIEPPGTPHTEESIIQAITDVDKNARERIAEGKEHPRGLNKSPFIRKAISSDLSYAAKEKWAVENNYRIPFYIENSFDFARKAEPVILKWKDFVKDTGLDIKKDSISLYRVNDNKQEEILCQVNGSDIVNEIVFIDDFATKRKNEYILYFGKNPSTQKNNNGITIDKTEDGKAEKISNGIVCAEIRQNAQITLSDEKTGKSVLALHGFGGRYEGHSYNGIGKFNWTIKGPVYCRLEIKSCDKGTTFHTVFEFFHNSPYIKISYSSNSAVIGMDEGSYRPEGHIFLSSADVLTASGWIKMNNNETQVLLPMKNNVATIIRQQNTIPFGWFLTYSDISEHPGLLLTKSSKGEIYFILEFAKHHADFIPQWKPQVSWMYVHNISSENEIDNYTKVLATQLPITSGPVETMKK